MEEGRHVCEDAVVVAEYFNGGTSQARQAPIQSFHAAIMGNQRRIHAVSARQIVLEIRTSQELAELVAGAKEIIHEEEHGNATSQSSTNLPRPDHPAFV
jgi:hypothetical protein